MTTSAPHSAQAPAAPAQPWHTLSPAETEQHLQVSAAQGLRPAEATARLETYGHNRLAEKTPRPRWMLFIDQFKNLLVMTLVGAAVLAGMIGELKDAAVILFVTLVNAMLGYYQENRAEQSLLALKQMLAPVARVRRGGEVTEIAAEELVPGDVVLLEAGSKVPADGRLVLTQTLEIDESALTGESHPVAKDARAAEPVEAPLADRVNMGFLNTIVTRGRGEMVVTSTGMQTETGHLAATLTELEEPPTPLQIQLDQLGKRLSLIALGVIALVVVVSLWQGKSWVDTTLEAIALAVAAIPEGLPAVVTVTLAIGMQRMARNRAIVKRLAAVETLGATTVACSDKTGTLTMNQMTARAFVYRGRGYTVEGEGYRAAGRILPQDGDGADPVNGGELDDLLEPMALCNDSHVRDGQIIGDPMEAALVVLGEKGGLRQESLEASLPRIAEVPFDSEYKFMATFHQRGEEVLLFMKGAPEALLDRCATVLGPKGPEPLDEAGRQRVLEHNRGLAARQMRVLAAARRTLPATAFSPDGDHWPHLQDLTLVGLVGLVDPARPEAAAAIAQCRLAGIEVKMITGDQRDTAESIARELGLTGKVLTGADLDAMQGTELDDIIDEVSVFARVAPVHKVKLVEALQHRGHVVAMTGDGVNDAPALKRAHIGVAMGESGTEVAKEASTMVLTDDNFATIVGAIREGRTIYENIVKFVRFQLSTNIGAILSVLTANLIGFPSPFHPVQILWINIIMDGPPAMAMGLEPAQDEIMGKQPRDPNAQILSWGRLSTLLSYGTLMVIGTLGTWWYSTHHGNAGHALTMAFTTFVLFQFFNAFNARVEEGTIFTRHLFTNRVLWGSLAGVLVMQVLAVHWGFFQSVFHTTDLTLREWGIAVGVAATILVLGEMERLIIAIARGLRG